MPFFHLISNNRWKHVRGCQQQLKKKSLWAILDEANFSEDKAIEILTTVKNDHHPTFTSADISTRKSSSYYSNTSNKDIIKLPSITSIFSF
jgi:hypothetical protein